jgi:hypothetical protein
MHRSVEDALSSWMRWLFGISYLLLQETFQQHFYSKTNKTHNLSSIFNPLNAELNLICYLQALLGAHHFLHVSRIRVKSLTLRLIMSYIYTYIYIYIYMERLFSAGERPQAARLLRSWFRIPPVHEYLSVVSVMCCQVEVSATSWSLVQRSPTDCAASLCVI